MKTRSTKSATETGNIKDIKKMFDNIVYRYDLLNDILSFNIHRYWKNFMVSKALSTNAKAYLDVACGTGDIIYRLKKGLSHSAKLYGIDISMEMIKHTKNRYAKEGFLLVNGDAHNLPFYQDQDKLQYLYGNL